MKESYRNPDEMLVSVAARANDVTSVQIRTFAQYGNVGLSSVPIVIPKDDAPLSAVIEAAEKLQELIRDIFEIREALFWRHQTPEMLPKSLVGVRGYASTAEVRLWAAMSPTERRNALEHKVRQLRKRDTYFHNRIEKFSEAISEAIREEESEPIVACRGNKVMIARELPDNVFAVWHPDSSTEKLRGEQESPGLVTIFVSEHTYHKVGALAVTAPKVRFVEVPLWKVKFPLHLVP